MEPESKPWLAHYPAEVSPEIVLEPEATLIGVLDQAIQRHAQQPALEFMGKTLSYAQLDQHANSIAAWLQATGLPKGSRVALMMPNGLPYLMALLATLRAGMVVVNVNPQYTERELEHQLADSNSQAIFIMENFAHVLAQVPEAVRPEHIVLTRVGDLMGLKGIALNLAVRYLKRLIPSYVLPTSVYLNRVLEQGAHMSFSPHHAKADELAVLQYTGGTTGRPKGAMLSQHNLLANVLQVQEVGKPALGDVHGKGYIMFAALPLYHVFALTICGLFALYAGMRIVLVMNPRDLKSVSTAWAARPPHVVPAVNTLFNALAHHEQFRRLPFAQLRLCLAGGAALQKTVAEHWLKLTGRALVEGYGLTETSPVVAVNNTDSTQFSGSIGFPLPSTDVILINEQEQQVALGEQGELAVQGPQVMRAYWRQEQETRDSFTREGYFKTGDIGTMDTTGRIRIVDRKKDMILVSGFNVYPNEIEEVLASHPGVLEVAAVGVPDEHTGEAIKVFVVRRDAALTEAELRSWCRQELTGYKRPKVYEFREELPKSNVGKILRRVLRDKEKAV